MSAEKQIKEFVKLILIQEVFYKLRCFGENLKLNN